MRYLSTRGQIEPVSFCDAVMMGLARDKGLLLPESIPDVRGELARWATLSYTELAYEVVRLFATDIPAAELRDIIERSYSTFTHEEVVPLVPVGELYVQELFHGPTLAFKDCALQVLGNLFEHILKARGGRLNILGATSGDTGSAAIYGVRGKAGIHIFILHPDGKVSPVQERQMTAVLDANVHNVAIAGTFDDGQRIVKELFGDLEFKDAYDLGAVNSVNWARVLVQVVYYFHGALRACRESGRESIRVCVPTGNFGNIFAGWLAREMGAPISQLILATNENDILARYFRTGEYSMGDVHPTLSPSMDIQVASNFERFLYYAVGQDPAEVRRLMAAFAESGRITVPLAAGEPAIIAGVGNTAETLATIGETYRTSQYVLDPHSAVGVAVANRLRAAGEPIVCLATAHPAKFADAVKQATGRDDLTHHPAIDGLMDAETRCAKLPATTDAIRQHIVQTLG